MLLCCSSLHRSCAEVHSFSLLCSSIAFALLCVCAVPSCIAQGCVTAAAVHLLYCLHRDPAHCPCPPRRALQLQDYANMLREAGFDGVAAFDRTEQVGRAGRVVLAACWVGGAPLFGCNEHARTPFRSSSTRAPPSSPSLLVLCVYLQSRLLTSQPCLLTVQGLPGARAGCSGGGPRRVHCRLWPGGL